MTEVPCSVSTPSFTDNLPRPHTQSGGGVHSAQMPQYGVLGSTQMAKVVVVWGLRKKQIMTGPGILRDQKRALHCFSLLVFGSHLAMLKCPEGVEESHPIQHGALKHFGLLRREQK